MKAFIFDTETDGLISSRLMPLDRQPQVIEFYGALVDLDTGEVMDEFESLVKPLNEIDEKTKAFKKVGITNAMVADAPRFASIAPTIKAIIEGSPLIIAHNASFDKEMMDIEFERIGETIQWPRVLCTVEQTGHLVGYRLSLTELHKYLFKGKKFHDAHRAKNDVQALIACCVELRKRGVL